MPKQPTPLPPLSVLTEIFSYDPDTGAITNKVSRTSRKAGARADNVAPNGYRMVYAAGRLWPAHRVAWKLFHGVDPVGFVDHANGDGADNRITNLRECSHGKNMQNMRLRSDSSTGIKGVSRETHRWYRNAPWKAYITVGGRRFTLGRYATKTEAASVVAAARRSLHGTFARFD